MIDESIEYVGTFPSYYQKIVPGTSSAPENDIIPVNIGVPGCSSDLKEHPSKFEDTSDSEMDDNCSEFAEVPETIPTPMVEKESNLSMDYRKKIEIDEQSPKNHMNEVRILMNISEDVFKI
ncbi:hypothetical protein JTB14_002367 [Gonioctena quinquepunctata]|nr:hypothetical protein JTB14_002367 [Gonioctena quinquepunctata]